MSMGQGGKVAKPHVVNSATRQPCNPVSFTSGNMPAGTDNNENCGKVAKLHVGTLATLQPCNLATLLFSHQATCLPAPINMKKWQSGKVAKLQSRMWSTLPLCNLATLLFSHQATCLLGADKP
jgi:hypothetical protein